MRRVVLSCSSFKKKIKQVGHLKVWSVCVETKKCNLIDNLCPPSARYSEQGLYFGMLLPPPPPPPTQEEKRTQPTMDP